jgi:hypothetical protein
MARKSKKPKPAKAIPLPVEAKKTKAQLLSEKVDRLNIAMLLLLNHVRAMGNGSNMLLDQVEQILSHKEG